MDHPTIVQLVEINNEGDSSYRMRWPGMQLAEQEPSWRIINLNVHAAERHTWGEQADLLVLYQSQDPDMLALMQRRRAAGKRTLAEYNDNFYAPPPASPAAEAWSIPTVWHNYETFVEQADGIIVTGAGLYNLLDHKTEAPVTILENHLPDTPPQFDAAKHAETGEIRIGWAGSIGHIADLLAIKRVIERLLNDYPNLVFCVMGNTSIPAELGLPENRIRYRAWGSMESYYDFLRQLHIGFIPLLPTPYNECRSDVKAIELSSRSVAPLLPDAVPYREFIRHTAADSYTSLAEMERLARRFIEQPEIRLAAARTAHNYVSAQRVGASRLERLDLYRSYLPERPGATPWNLPAGYHEVAGTPEPQAPYTLATQKVQQLMQAQQWRQAAAKAHGSVNIYPDSAELALQHIRCCARYDTAQAQSLLTSYSGRFAKDVRFPITQAILARDPERRRASWQTAIGVLQRENRVYRDYFRDVVAQPLGRWLQRDGDAADLAEQILKLIPDAADVRYELARYYERRGLDERACTHIAKLTEDERSVRRTPKFFSQLSVGYLQSWNEALQGRLNEGDAR